MALLATTPVLSWSRSSFQALGDQLSRSCEVAESAGCSHSDSSRWDFPHVRDVSRSCKEIISQMSGHSIEDGQSTKRAATCHSQTWQKSWGDSKDGTDNGSRHLGMDGSLQYKPLKYAPLMGIFSTPSRKSREPARKETSGAQVFTGQIGSKAQRRLRHLLFSESGEPHALALFQNDNLWSFLNDALRQRNWRGALDVFEAMKQVQGYQASVRIYTMMVRIMAKSKQPYRAFQLFEEMGGAECGQDVSSFTALLDAYGRSGLLEQAVAVFEQMKSTPACKPNVFTYNCMINAYGRAQLWDKIDALTKEMDDLGVRPLDITFNVLISAYGKGALYLEMEKVFDRMHIAKCKPDVFTFNTMIDAYGKGLKYAQMEWTYKRMLTSKGNPPDILTYSSLMDAYGKAGQHEKVEATLVDMCAAGCKPDVKAYSLLIDIYGKQGRLEKMEATLKGMQSAGCRANVVTYTGILDAYGKAGLYEKMEDLWVSMKNMLHLKPDISAYVTILSAYGKGGLYDKMEKTFEELMALAKDMKIVGPRPGRPAYNVLIDAYGKGKVIEKMEVAFNEMQQTGHQPNVITYTSLIDAYGKAGLHNKMDECFTAMKATGCAPNMQTYGSLIDGYGRLGMVRKAEKAVADMCAAGYRPDLVTYTSIIDMYNRAKDLQSMIARFNEMIASGFEPSCVTIGVILSSLSTCRTWEEASSILECVRRCPNFGVIGRLLEDEEDKEDASKLMQDVERSFDRLPENGPQLVLYDALIETLWSFGLQKRAFQVLNLGRRKGAFPHAQVHLGSEIHLDLHMLSSSVAEVMLLAWLTDLKADIPDGTVNAEHVSVVTGWGKRSKVEGDSPLKTAVSVRLDAMGSPFRIARENAGRLVAPFGQVCSWLQCDRVAQQLVLENAAHSGPGYYLSLHPV